MWRLVPWPVWVGLAGAIALGATAYTVWVYNKGAANIVNKVERAKNQQIRRQIRANQRVDRTTLQRDADLVRGLKELDERWDTKPPQQ